MADRLRADGSLALPTMLLADASAEYRAMAQHALLEARNATDLRLVRDGGELVSYLRRAGAFAGPTFPRPRLIVLDADLPGEPPGLQAVTAIKRDAALRRIPIVALGSDDTPEAVARAYEAGVNTYIVKPVTFLALVRLMKVFTAYWLDTAELPQSDGA